jgi:hypothetical protein
MGGMEVFLPLLEQVEYDESTSCETTEEEEEKVMKVKIEKNTARFVCTSC